MEPGRPCLFCQIEPARPIPELSGDGDAAGLGLVDVFCSERCAARYAVNEVRAEDDLGMIYDALHLGPSGPLIGTSWRPNGPDVDVEIGWRFLVAMETVDPTRGAEVAVVTVLDEHGRLTVETDPDRRSPSWDYRWEHIDWYIPIEEITPVLPRLPTTPDEIRAAEASLKAHPVELPEWLRKMCSEELSEHDDKE